ncbi:uncharacterized protein LOC135218532 isoform X2 [Macrobrachium nipponense]|uniref:uncharacterized protein LOC135218532 isoform X2 n=1 Tax=Macrobrachium nipponense TaxID=159736 RepID=UPI0030C8ACCD
MATKTKTIASFWLFTLLLIKVSISPSASEEPVVLWDNEPLETIPDADVGAGTDADVGTDADAGAGADAGADADAEDTSDTPIEFLDVTDLRDGLNDWNFLGMWSKYDLSDLQEEHKLVPENPERDDQAVLICHTIPMGSVLEKKFPALENGSLILSYYIAAKANFSMLGQAIDLAIDKTQEIFNYSFPHDLAEHNNTWVMESFKLLNFSNEFKVKFTLVGDANGLWATDEIEVRGFKPKSSPIVIPGLPEPGDNSTDIVVPGIHPTHPTGVEGNVTVDVDATTEGSNINSGNETSSNGTDAGVNGTGTNVNGTDNGDNTTDGPDKAVPGPSAFEDSNVTAIPSSHLTEASPSNVSQETNVTVVPGTHWNEHPELNVTNAPQGDVSGPPETNVTHGPGVHVWGEVPHPNGTKEPAANVSVLPPNIPGKPPNGAPEDPHSGYPSGISDTSSFEENVNKLAGVAQAIWDAFYVFLALFCACLVAIVGLIVRGRCKDGDSPPAAVATYNPRTASYRLDKVYDNPSYDTNAV